MLSLTHIPLIFALLGLLECVLASPQVEMPFSNEQATDVVEIQQVVNLFAIAVDQHRLELLPQIFTASIVADFGLPDGTILRGLDAVTQNLRTIPSVPAVHSQSTDYVNFSNPRQPHATTYLTATFFGSGDLKGQVFTNYGRQVATVSYVVSTTNPFRS